VSPIVNLTPTFVVTDVAPKVSSLCRIYRITSEFVIHARVHTHMPLANAVCYRTALEHVVIVVVVAPAAQTSAVGVSRSFYTTHTTHTMHTHKAPCIM
jgi:hypothetical protein